jgi:hypothetical protein
MTRARSAAWWTLPALICLAVHWRGFEAWFRADDFAWLSLYGQIHNFHDLLRALFRPEAQGTIRPWSERAFFIVGYALFGLNALPYRIVIFATQFLTLALVQSIGARLTGSRAAGLCAAILWTVNSSSAEPLGWACVYNEVMCAAFLLLALWMFIRRHYLLEWLVFLAGFGALELNIVYPLLRGVAGRTGLPNCGVGADGLRGRKKLDYRRFWRQTAAMLAVSLLYFVLHTLAAPSPQTGPYAMHFEPSVLRTLAAYWTWSLGPVYLSVPARVRRWMILLGIGLISIALLVFLVRKLQAGYRAALFCIAWYLITLAPLLPLRDHMTEYYPYIPVIGLAWLGGWGLSEAWKRGGRLRIAAAALALMYVALVLPRTLWASNWNYAMSMEARDLVAGVARARQLHPGEAILLDGIDRDQFVNAIRHRAFLPIGIDRVYLAAASEKRFARDINDESEQDLFLASSAAANALDAGQLEVYDVRGGLLRNITSEYAASLHADGLPLRVSVSDPMTAYLLGPEWYALDIDHRWMGRRATLRIGAPSAPGGKLHLTGFCPEGLGEDRVTVSANAIALPPATVKPGKFDLALPLPEALAGQPELHVSVDSDKTFRPPGETRDLSLSFGVFEIK